MSTAASPITVVIVDDSPIIRLGLRSALEDYPDLAIVGEAGTASEGVAAIERLSPQIALLDLHLPDNSGLHACRECRRVRPHTRVLILTSDSNERNVQEAMAAGAHGYLLKDNDGVSLAAALRAVATGSKVVDPTLMGQVLNSTRRQSTRSAAERINQLSFQERRVVALLADGLTNKQIGEQMKLTEKTVKNYLSTIFTKLNIERRSQAAALHVEAGQAAEF